ncbi:MAG: methylenetetrahydrofolate reductase C-terminal domain-containing protein [Chloroflexota bacterium]
MERRAPSTLAMVVNPLRTALTNGTFCYVVELVASRLTREARLLEVASGLAQIPDLVAGSITSYAGGGTGHDPLRVAAAARARGLTPNVHVTCVSQTRTELRRALEDIHALGMENVFALTGDYPQADDTAHPAVFDIDSVQLVAMIDELRTAGKSFNVAVAVSPFKYTEPDCMYQYLKLEKKIAAGANWAVTQVGWDARKFAELKRYLDERGLKTPLLGNVYVLGKRVAERMATGSPPGCWVSPALLQAVTEESAAFDRGRAARLERAAKSVAVLRGLGYAGAYIGGTHDPDEIRTIIRRSVELAPTWTELAEELNYGRPGGFYLYDSQSSSPTRSYRRRELVPWLLSTGTKFFPANRDTPLRGALTAASTWVDQHAGVARALEQLEMSVKEPVFGCQACGNCVLSYTEYVCPQTCPKQLRNGPCGGTSNGRCEVVDKECIWVSVYERAQERGGVDELRTFVPAPDRALIGTSSWINYFLERDRRPRPEAGDESFESQKWTSAREVAPGQPAAIGPASAIDSEPTSGSNAQR